MRILHVNKFFDLNGGAETYLHELMARQAARGHETHILSTRFSRNLPSPDEHSFVKRHDYSQSEGAAKDAEKAVSFIWNREARRAMKLAIAEHRPQVIHLHNIYHHLSSSILGVIRKSGIPCVQTLHDYKLACPNYRMFTEGSVCERCKGGNYLEAVKHRCLWPTFPGNMLATIEMGLTKATQAYERTVNYFLCPSQFMAEKMREWGEPPSKLRLLRNPADVSVESATLDGGYLLYAGRLSPEKGIETLIRAVARIPECRLKIAGIGPEEARLKQLTQTLGARNVLFLGFIRRSQNLELWQKAQALVVPSVWYENASIAVLEAMAQGLPVIASRIGGLPEQVEHGVNGLLASPGDVDAWESAIRTYLTYAPEVRAKMGQEAQRRVKEIFSWDKHLVELDGIYESLVL
jgi:glycosyltransferase involved in cell wall biosynthesis